MRQRRKAMARGGALAQCGCYADGGRVGSRERARQTAPSPLAALGALFDMGAGALRGATSATLGLPGDLESLVRLVTGGENVMPTTEQVSAKLPALGALSIPADKNPYQDLGEFIPLTPPKAVTSAAKKLGREGLRALDRGMQGQGALAQVLAPVQPAYAVRPKGGNFHEQRLAGYLGALNIGTPEYFDLIGDPLREFRQDAVGDWGAKQLKNYLRKDVGTPTDPLLQVEKEFPNLHLPEGYLSDPWKENNVLAVLDAGDALAGKTDRFVKAAKLHRSLTDQPLTPWGKTSGEALHPVNPSEYVTEIGQGSSNKLSAAENLDLISDYMDPEVLKKLDWLRTAPDDTKIWSLMDPRTDALGFNHVLDYLEAATKADEYVKRAGPDTLALLRQGPAGDWGDKIRLYDAGLALDSKSLERLSVADAVRKTAQWNEFLAKQGANADPDLARGIARVHKEYPDDGMKWVELGAGDGEAVREGFELRQTPNGWAVYGPDSAGRMVNHFNPKPTKEAALAEYRKSELSAGLNAEGKAMGHCVGGYCDEVAERGTKIYSLRDKNGNPHVTVEVRPGRQKQPPTTDYAWRQEFGDEAVQAIRAEMNRDYDPELSQMANMHRAARTLYPDYFEAGKNAPDEIIQIKGKQNAAPVEKYLPYVQDFVKSGQWGRVGDLRNTGLRQIGGKYFSNEELGEAMKRAGGFGHGPEELDTEYFDNLLRMPERLDDDDRRFMEALGIPLPPRQGYASGGSVQPNTQQDDPLAAFEAAVVHLEKLYAA